MVGTFSGLVERTRERPSRQSRQHGTTQAGAGAHSRASSCVHLFRPPGRWQCCQAGKRSGIFWWVLGLLSGSSGHPCRLCRRERDARLRSCRTAVRDTVHENRSHTRTTGIFSVVVLGRLYLVRIQ